MQGNAYIGWMLITLGFTAMAHAGHGPASPSTRMDSLIEQANQRIAAGQAPQTVEQWLLSAARKVASVQAKPQAWDVYGRAHWQEAADEVDKAPTEQEPPEDIAVRSVP